MALPFFCLPQSVQPEGSGTLEHALDHEVVTTDVRDGTRGNADRLAAQPIDIA